MSTRDRRKLLRNKRFKDCREMQIIDNLKEKETNGDKQREEWPNRERKKIKAMKKMMKTYSNSCIMKMTVTI